MDNWMTTCNNDEDLVISSRMRLARNLAKVPFPHKLNVEKGREIIKRVENAFYTSADNEKEFKTNYLWEKDNNERQLYLEKHLISKNLIDNSDKTAFILNNKETVSIMINEEDHIRIQCITAGLNLEEAYDLSNKIDDFLEEKLEYAFDEKWGYLTACPTNIGTGLRASVMVHLPALSLNNQINGLLNALAQVGMTIRGLYGEGSKPVGNIYQISNQVTLGRSEKEIVSNLKAIAIQVINEEKISRENLVKKYKNELEDRIYRALGILRSAVLLSSNECLRLLSDVRLGVEMGIIKDVDKVTLNNLLVNIQPAAIQREGSRNLSSSERDFNRAKLVREKLAVNKV
ncbi:protein arginine kinase [Clostridium luticellarii]|uniref:Protein-arginine kinase n=1 Tax=Clostridium luticellarii TaxID=1691940 RepID=A0A2T0BS08_9CLOT|nr:protein arginine kinase [Clostridium luticellarii]MCI1944660.1 protein arginine kinase [Clostridium luticellarii]MCI1968157.1 protein arginine kinase [Clostridium luticellarii]MCI1995298.1 protein arginine kinase [Clostridium luticellarii]MCI2039705.1 protein arginine kinase [Clostridium luticellarii]PRR86686.1 putative ATP:guanido phosphotransferase [Clostridium luticellarii]